MNHKISIGVIFGGRSGEHEVSLMSARSILSVLDPDKYEVIQIGVTHQGAWLVGDEILEKMVAGETRDLTPVALLQDPTRQGIYRIEASEHGEILAKLGYLDVVFPVLHGTYGEDGTIQGLFEMAGIAYVGAGVLGSSLGMDKGVFRDVMRAHNIPVVDTLVVTRKEIRNRLETILSRAEELAPYPLFVKPANLGSSVGVSKCVNRSDLLEGLMESARYDRRVLIERGIAAREIEVSVLGNDDPVASIPGEIIPSAEFYTYDAKYHDDRSKLLIPAPLPFEISERIRRLALKAYRVIDCAGMARVDFLLERDDGELYLSEVNTIPGFTKISMYPKLWQASGLPYSELVDRLIELALERKSERDNTEWHYQRQ
jgi:D-alanine-D-alanine ligase